MKKIQKSKDINFIELGFTLIELLAVIVILAIIALIAIPLIGNVIEKAKIGALENSVNGLVESANMYYANQSIKGEQSTETVFDFTNGEQTSTEKLEYKGKVYNGKLILHANGEVAVCIDDKEHYAYKNKDSDEIVSGVGTCVYDGTTGDFSSNSSIKDLRGKTVVANTITKNDDETKILIKMPEEGHYDETSQISVLIDDVTNILNKKIDNMKPALSTTAVQSGSSFTCATSGYVFGFGATNPIVIYVNDSGEYHSTRDGVKVSKGDVIKTNGNGNRNFALLETNKEISLDTLNPTIVPDMTNWTAPTDGYIVSVGIDWLSISINGVMKEYGLYATSYPVSEGDIVYCNGNGSRGHAFYTIN